MNRTVGIIQARMNSQRLPGKVLAGAGGVPLLDHVVRRAESADYLNDVVVATTTDAADDEIFEFCELRGVKVFRGHADDVLDRYARAAWECDAQVIVRLTADCPLLDPLVIDSAVARFAEGGFDYVSNALVPTYPDGLDTEVFSRQALERAHREARLPSEREHVTAYFTNHPELFRIGQVQCETDYSHLRWTVDEPEDLVFVRSVFAARGNGVFGMESVLALLAEQPALQRINAGFERNEGYARSLAQDSAAGGAPC